VYLSEIREKKNQLNLFFCAPFFFSHLMFILRACSILIEIVIFKLNVQ
jgi:hypothetical protein